MRRTLIWVGVTVACAVVAAIAGAVWWSLWMNHSWPGATGLLAKVLGAQGEHYYDAMQDEMTVWSFVGALMLVVGWSAYKKRRGQ